MKTYNPKFSVGSLFICSKCGKSFDQPDYAENLKSELRGELKKIEASKKVRVMVSGCLGVCEDKEQTFAYYPNQGSLELQTTSVKFDEAQNEILNFIQKKI